MSTIIAEPHEALDAGAAKDKAREAARAIAEYENRCSKIDSDLRILKWMVGATLAGVISISAGIASLLIKSLILTQVLSGR